MENLSNIDHFLNQWLNSSSHDEFIQHTNNLSDEIKKRGENLNLDPDSARRCSKLFIETILEKDSLPENAALQRIRHWLLQGSQDHVAIIAPSASISIIKNYQIAKKFQVRIPETIQLPSFRCLNPTCITNHDQMSTTFYIFKQSDNVILHCKYCENSFSQDEMDIESDVANPR